MEESSSLQLESDTTAKPTLGEILDADADQASHRMMPFCKDPSDSELGAPPAAPNMCIECADTPAQLFCENCGDDFCTLCWHATHRKGSRSHHHTRPFGTAGAVAPPPTTTQASPSTAASSAQAASPFTAASATAAAAARPSVSVEEEEDLEDGSLDTHHMPKTASPPAPVPSAPGQMAERAKWIPLRLTLPVRYSSTPCHLTRPLCSLPFYAGA